MTERLIQQRLLLFQAVVLIAFVALTVQLFRLQILQGQNYQLLSQENSVAFETISGSRGVIYDRQGQILVRNRPLFRATVQPALVHNETWLLWQEADYEQAATVLAGIADVLEMDFPRDGTQALKDAFAAAGERATRGETLSVVQINDLCAAGDYLQCYVEALIVAPYEPITIQADVPQEIAFVAMEKRINLPGLEIVADSQRDYLYGSLYGHIIGYQLPITQEQLDRQTRFTTNPYLAADRVGAAGIEAGWEEQLRGVRGQQRVEVNVVGRQIRVLQEDPAQPGQNVFLTIDTALQQEVTLALQEGLDSVGSQEGVAIVMNPQTGEILAMVSLPNYDNNLFAGEMDPQIYAQLSTDPLKPMFNRAISGAYPPGSIFKIIPAVAALAEGVITRDTAINDPGTISIPSEADPTNVELNQEFVCWLRSGHDDETVVDAIAHSCDVFFYEVAGGYLDQFRGLGIDRLAEWATNFGLGEPTRINLPGEVAGRVPTRQWKRLYKQASWVLGDTYNMAIGQGDVLVTPLQILNATTAIANGGTIYEPQIVYQVQSADGSILQGFEPRVLRKLPADPAIISMVAEGMRGAIAWEEGTARFPFEGVGVSVAGKTGTAEYCPVITKPDGTYDCKYYEVDGEQYQLTHAWFTAFAPYEEPEIAIVVFIGGNNETVIQGSETAAPVARRIVDYYFSRNPVGADVPPAPIPQSVPGVTATPPLNATATIIQPTPIPTQPPAPTANVAGTQPTAAPDVAVPTSPPAPQAPPTATAPPAPTATSAAPSTYRGVLVGTAAQGNELSVVVGRVIDANGAPVGGVTITLDGGGAPVATLTTGADGSFRYDLLNATQATTWYVRAASLPGSPLIALNVAPYEQYTVAFTP